MTHKQKVLELLSDGQPHTHHELYQLGCVAHSRIADLRRDGHEIECWRDGALSMYRLTSLGEPSSNHHAGDAHASGGVTDGDGWPSEIAPETKALRVSPEQVSLPLFDEDDVAA